MNPVEEIVTTFVSPQFSFVTMQRRVVFPHQEQEEAMLAGAGARAYLRPRLAERLALIEQLVRASGVGSQDLSRPPKCARAVLGVAARSRLPGSVASRSIQRSPYDMLRRCIKTRVRLAEIS